MSRTPALRPGLISDSTSGELVVVDPSTGVAHLLTGAAAEAFHVCSSSSGVAAPEGLAALAEAGLMETGPSRRTLVAGAAVGAGLITALGLPTMAAAASTVTGGGEGGGPAQQSVDLSTVPYGTDGDPNFQFGGFSADGTAPAGSAYTAPAPTASNGDYARIVNPVTGLETTYLSDGTQDFGHYYFSRQFVLPAGATDVQLNLQTRQDDAVEVFLNGTSIGTGGLNFGGPDTVFSASSATLPGSGLIAGTNSIVFDVTNTGGTYGVDVVGTVTYTA